MNSPIPQIQSFNNAVDVGDVPVENVINNNDNDINGIVVVQEQEQEQEQDQEQEEQDQEEQNDEIQELDDNSNGNTTKPIAAQASLVAPIVASSLVEQCFEVIMANLDHYQNSDLSNILPLPIKDKMFAYYTSKISNEPSTSPFPITSYPEDRYRDVQLVNRITCQRVIPLCFAMWSSLDYRYEKVRKLIEEEACDVNESDLEGFCPLHYAAIYGRIDACKLLLMHGADCSRKNNFGKTPADLAQDVKVQQMIKLRAILFRKEEVKEMEQDLIIKRKKIEEFKKKKLIEDFLSNSKQFSSVLEQKGYNMKKRQTVKSQQPQSQSLTQTQQLQQTATPLHPQPISTSSNNNNNSSIAHGTFRGSRNSTTENISFDSTFDNNILIDNITNNTNFNNNNNNNISMDTNAHIIDSTVNNNNLSITSPTPSIVMDGSNAADNTLRTFIAQVDLPTSQQLSGVNIAHHHHHQGTNSYSQVTHSLSNMAISIPRTRQSNSTGPIPHHTIGLDSLLVANLNEFNSSDTPLKSDLHNPHSFTPISTISTPGEEFLTSTTSTASASSSSLIIPPIGTNIENNSSSNNSADIIHGSGSNQDCRDIESSSSFGDW